MISGYEHNAIFMNISQSRILKKVSFISRFRSKNVRNFIGRNLVKTHQCVRYEK